MVVMKILIFIREWQTDNDNDNAMINDDTDNDMIMIW